MHAKPVGEEVAVELDSDQLPLLDDHHEPAGCHALYFATVAALL